MQQRLKLSLLAVLLLSAGWLGISGFPMLVAMIPLLYISSSLTDSKRDWWRMAGWAALIFVGWNALTVWLIALATPIGPLAATFFTTFWCMVAFMLFHYVSKRAHKSIAYTTLVAAWVAAEYLYTLTEVISFPWLTLGNAFSGEVWAVQWYEYTGVMGGSMWVVICNIAIFEALQRKHRRAISLAAATVIIPIVVSLAIYFTYKPEAESVKISVIQPNVDCYDEKFNNTERKQLQNLLSLIGEAPTDSRIIVMPETALPETIDDDTPQEEVSTSAIASALSQSHPQTMVAAGASTIKYYDIDEPLTPTARIGIGYNYDIFNSAIAINGDGEKDVHHKMRLVIGVEAMPSFVSHLDSFIDLGGITGQLGRNDKATVFEKGGVKAGPAICYEGLYGDWFARFVREGAEVMLVMSNDGWWGNTPGHRRLFDFCRLRAIETRRAVARSANTGVSGFITSRGDVVERLDWDERGVLTQQVERSNKMTIYTIYGDWVGRMSLLVTFLAVMYFTAYRVRRRNHLVD